MSEELTLFASAHAVLPRRRNFKYQNREKVAYVSPIPVAPEIKEWKSLFRLIHIKSMEEFLAVYQKFIDLGCPPTAIDTETTALSFLDAELVGFSFSFETGIGYYVPVGHLVGDNLPKEEAINLLFSIMYSTSICYFYHYRFDARILRKYGLDVFKVRHFDVMVLIYNLDTNQKYTSLKKASLLYLGIRQQTFEGLLGADSEEDMEDMEDMAGEEDKDGEDEEKLDDLVAEDGALSGEEAIPF